MAKKHGARDMGQERQLDADEIELEAERLEKAVARKKRALRQLAKLEGKPQSDEPLDPEPSGELPGSARIQEILAELAGEGSIEIYKLANGRQSKIATYDVTAWPEGVESLVRQHGGGDFILVFRSTDGQIASRVMRTFDPQTYGSGSHPTAAAGASSSDAMMLRFFELQQAADARHRQEMETMRLELAKAAAESSKMVLEVLKAQQGGGLFKSAQDIAVIAKLFKEESSPLDKVLDLKDLLDELRGESRQPDEGPILGILSRLTDALAPRQPKLSRPVASANGAGAPAARPAALPNAQPQTREPVKEPAAAAPSLEQYRAQFRAAIEHGYTPDQSAEAVWEAVKDNAEKRDPVLAVLARGNWAALGADEYLKDHMGWVADFRKKLAELAVGQAGGQAEPRADEQPQPEHEASA